MCKLILSILLVCLCYIKGHETLTTLDSTNPNTISSVSPSRVYPSSPNVTSRTAPSSTYSYAEASQHGNPTYEGCFDPFHNNTILDSMYHFDVWNDELGPCFQWCAGLRFNFAAIHGGRLSCYCGFNLTEVFRRVDDTECSDRCTDLPSFTCGGDEATSLYSLTHLFPPEEGEVDASEGSVSFLISHRGSVQMYNLSDPNSPQQLVFVKDLYGYAVDYHYRKNLMFMSAETALYKTTLLKTYTSSVPSIHIEMGRCTDFAVDWVQDRIFWIDCTSSPYALKAVDLEGQNMTTIQTLETITILRIDIDPYCRTVFWLNFNGMIASCDTNGANLHLGVNHAGVEVSVMTLDISNKRLFYFGMIDISSTLYSVDYSGNDLKTYLDITQKINPYEIGITRGFVYWISDGPSGALFKAQLYHNYSSTPVKLLKMFNNSVGSMKIFDPDLQKAPDSDFSSNTGGLGGIGHHIRCRQIVTDRPTFTRSPFTTPLMTPILYRPPRCVTCTLNRDPPVISSGFSISGAEMRKSSMNYDSEGNKTSLNIDQNSEPSNSRSECLLPEDPGNRLFCHYQCPKCILNPYSSCSYPSRTQKIQAIKVQCLPGYGLATGQDHSVSICIDNAWVHNIPECQKVCPPLESDFLDIECFNELTRVDCKKPMMVGIRATYKCKPSHREFPNLVSARIYKRVLVCKGDGRWTYYLPECEPICGVSRGNDTMTPIIVNGTATELGQFPWHAALYRRKSVNNTLWDNICGGSLITHRIVLSAAHCVSAVITSTADLRVALGKYFRNWAKDEKDAIRREIVSIRLPPDYKGGATSYTWDIALLLMNASVQFNSFVMPVCMNLESHNHLTNGDSGYVVGWGKTSPGGVESEILLFNTVTIMAKDDCQRNITLFLSFDKFCGTKNDVSVVQKGDSGGGLTAIVGGLHYIFGVVSTKSKSNEIPMFTNISWDSHERWIDREIINIIT